MHLFGSFGSVSPAKWFVTYDYSGVTYYLAEADNDGRHLTWSQQQGKAIKFDSSSDAEKVMLLVKSHRKNKKQVFKVR